MDRMNGQHRSGGRPMIKAGVPSVLLSISAAKRQYWIDSRDGIDLAADLETLLDSVK